MVADRVCDDISGGAGKRLIVVGILSDTAQNEPSWSWETRCGLYLRCGYRQGLGIS
jgi:hypothetical protein